MDGRTVGTDWYGMVRGTDFWWKNFSDPNFQYNFSTKSTCIIMQFEVPETQF